ncbi:DegT/DnrJ/EryC1/StrS aminotransferase family protein [Flammeovirga sp. OC4]|uniref:DegT/DnrJ/EryC1/StrS family aminotransferase n=1 Tax=Flammeovirga sp. OC4 TaxID=1382345 RepID=UPI0020A1F1D8|nr:DegT/DnrJ/EryC1/StrS family aminotransferase [Flammeovirga sp. OC4]
MTNIKREDISKIQMVDLHTQYLNIKEDVDKGIQEVIHSCAFINGPAVKSFAEELAIYNKVKHTVPCANGTDALQVAMMAVGLQPGDEVLVPVHTYVATAEVIALLQLTPVFVDVDSDLFTIDVSQIESKITPKTKAIVPVHLYGQCADMESIMQLSKKHNLFVIEDTAQAIGADYTFSDGTIKKAGTIGHIGCTSFFPSKNLGCYGDGGAMLINDDELAKKAKMIASHGQSIKYHHDIIGCNSRLDTIQAAILRVKLPHLDQYNSNRRRVAKKYDDSFKDIMQLQTPKLAVYSTHVYHQYTLKVEGVNRDELKEKLQEKGVPSMIYYPVPLHFQKAYSLSEFGKGSFPVTEHLSDVVLSLPIHTEMEEKQQNYIIQSILESINE